MKICLYTRNLPWGDWDRQFIELSRLPNTAEYLRLPSKEDWYEVRAVVHLVVDGADHQAEIYAERVERPLQYKLP